MQPTLHKDFELARKAFEVEDYCTAESLCRKMLKHLREPAAKADDLNEIRTLLIDSMIAVQESGGHAEPIIEELDRLFVGYLTANNRGRCKDTGSNCGIS
jgi:hypothetical protein